MELIELIAIADRSLLIIYIYIVNVYSTIKGQGGAVMAEMLSAGNTCDGPM